MHVFLIMHKYFDNACKMASKLQYLVQGAFFNKESAILIFKRGKISLTK